MSHKASCCKRSGWLISHLSQVSVDDVIAVREKSKKQARIKFHWNWQNKEKKPTWLDVDSAKMEGVFKRARAF